MPSPTEQAEARLSAIADKLANARNLLDAVEDSARQYRADYEQVEAELFEALEQQGLRSIRTDRGLFSLNDLAWAKIADAATARAWADENMPEVITLNHTRLSVVVREALKKGEEPPPGIDYTLSRKINWRRS